MNEIQRILHKYLPAEYIEIIAIESRQDDRVWMVEHGYKTDFVLDERGFPSGGYLTEKGKKYIDECEKKYRRLYSKIKNQTINTHCAYKELQSFIKKNLQKVTVLYNEMTDSEKRTYNYLLRY